MSKLTQLGFTSPYQLLSDGSVHGVFNGYPYHIHPIATPELWNILQEDISAGAVSMMPYISPPPEEPPTPSEIAIKRIKELERAVTPRRLRDAVLTDDGKKWLDDINSKITAIRSSL